MNTLSRMLAGGIAALAMIGAASATPSDPVTQAQIEAARTPEQHEAIARAYDEEAAAMEKRAETHAKMAQTYRYAYGKGGRASMASHCGRLEKDFRNAAAAYRELAKEHRQMAAQAK
ncbi:MAG: hypothetical protein KF822_04930 [Steroidobacteraceae bacterium]|nr:hypothetical protein [Steroidobacteraceae bacterium]